MGFPVISSIHLNQEGITGTVLTDGSLLNIMIKNNKSMIQDSSDETHERPLLAEGSPRRDILGLNSFPTYMHNMEQIANRIK